jgi:twitching motility protein PilT
MDLSALITQARDAGASDLHLEPALPAALRIRGSLQCAGTPLNPAALAACARDLIGDPHWDEFQSRRSMDLSRTLSGVRCRLNVFHTARGIGMAIRLLASFQATLERLNLHPDLRSLITRPHGLVLVCGSTGSGKSSTLAALLHEINLTENRHIITIESPIEFFFRPRRAFIRQREVGRDTPSFDQALLDALREDPDVLMVGEMREPETMRLTLNAAETGHLVLTTVHSSTCVEALQRIVGAFPSEIQGSVAAQLADCLAGVVAQHLEFRPELGIRVPECEILLPTNPIKTHLRNRDFFKIASVMETGADAGMWTRARYRSWMKRRPQWFVAPAGGETPDTEAPEESLPQPDAPPSNPTPRPPLSTPEELRPAIEIEPVDGGLDTLLKKLK